MARPADLDRFYALLADLADRVGGAWKLERCTGYMDWPDRGVYVFLAPGETRSAGQHRVTRVGTHAVVADSSTSLWDRLKGHSGTGAGSSAHPHGGNHRGSVYRERVGEALIERHGLHDDYPDWGTRWSKTDRDRGAVRDEEYPLERRVSTYVREQPFLPRRRTGSRQRPGVRLAKRHRAPEQLRAVGDRPSRRRLAGPTRPEPKDPRIGPVERRPRRRDARSVLLESVGTGRRGDDAAVGRPPRLLRRALGHRVRLSAAVNLQFAVETGDARRTVAVGSGRLRAVP